MVLEVHVLGTVKPTHAVFPLMKEQGFGRIMVTSSSSGLYGNFGQSNYGAGKMGVVGFMNTIKLEGEKYNVHINALAPIAATRMTEGLLPDEAFNLLEPHKVTPAVVYMCSDEAPTGKIICAGAGAFSVAQMVEAEGIFVSHEPQAERHCRKLGQDFRHVQRQTFGHGRGTNAEVRHQSDGKSAS